MVQEEERLVYTAYEVRRLLHVSRQTVYEGLRMNKIPHLKMGKRFLIPRVAFHRWLDESTWGRKSYKPNK